MNALAIYIYLSSLLDLIMNENNQYLERSRTNHRNFYVSKPFLMYHQTKELHLHPT